jgi:transcriptional regulator with XRE-family HTH domain
MPERTPRWEQPGYSDIVEARLVDGGLEVRFANGDVEWVPASLLGNDIPPDSPVEIRDGVAVEVGEAARSREIGWVSIRSATDAGFAQHLRDLDADESRRLGLRLKALREDRGLSQADLALLVGMTPPQLSRIERGGLDMRVSTVRALLRAMDATFVDIAGRDAPEASVRELVKRAVKAGVPRGLAAALTDAVPRVDVPVFLARAFHWSQDDLAAGVPETPALAVAVQFKARPGQQPHASPLIHLAFSTAQLARSAFELPPYHDLPTDPLAIRGEAIDAEGQVTLRSLVEWAWNRGIPVLPLNGVGGFSAAVWAIDQAPVIVIKESRDFTVFWLVDLAHEIGHIARGHVGKGIIDIESPTQPTTSDADEREATEFALRLLLPEHERLLSEVRADARGSHVRFKFAVERVAQRAGVSPGLLGMVAAFALPEIGQAKDRWGSATNLARPEGSGRELAQEAARRRLRVEGLDELDAALVRVAVLGEIE